MLQALATAYLALYAARVELIGLVRLRFLVVPFMFNPISGFLARHDPWYKYVSPFPFFFSFSKNAHQSPYFYAISLPIFHSPERSKC